ncbi:MAG: hypothetical protein E6H54_01305 [Betaproteobacteria bacterium]|nr:MAG: hypothetical protein E6H54_01305 [Betaproteobacteria bacterium]
MSSTARSRGTKRSASPIRRTSCRSRGGDMATPVKSGEKVDAVIAGASASGSVFAATLAKAGKKVVLLETGPDWQLSAATSRAGA